MYAQVHKNKPEPSIYSELGPGVVMDPNLPLLRPTMLRLKTFLTSAAI